MLDRDVLLANLGRAVFLKPFVGVAQPAITANIGRFVDLLRQFSELAQFIVVTHQKRTMEAADILYGVTMGADGVSQIVSKRLAGERESLHALSA